MIVVGVDPGARGTGVVVIDTGRSAERGAPGVQTGALPPPAPALLWATTVRRLEDGAVTSPPPAYLVAVVDTTVDAVTAHAAYLVAVEGIVRPNPHVNRANGKSLTNPEHILAAAMVFGAVVSRGYGAHLVIVRPGGNGSRPLGTYPDALVSSAERRDRRTVDLPAAERGIPWQLRPAGSGQLKDQRSAYDVAVAGHQHHRLTTRTGLVVTSPYTY